MQFNNTCLTLCCCVTLCALACPPLTAQGKVSFNSISPVESISFVDVDNAEHHVGGNRPIVLVFINADCPIANSYQPALQKLKVDYAKYEIDFVMIHGVPTISIDAAKKHSTEYSIKWSVAIDQGNTIAQHVGAKVTPEAFLIDAKGNVLYRGRIDDRNPEYGKKRVVPTREDLRIALDEFVAGKTISTPQTVAIGCVIRLPKNQGDK